MKVVITWYFHPSFSGLAASMSAEIARNLRSLVCSCLNSYYTFHLFPLLIFFFKFVALCSEFNLLSPFLLPYMIMDPPTFLRGCHGMLFYFKEIGPVLIT